jgi:cytochrome c oxidase subunit 1
MAGLNGVFMGMMIIGHAGMHRRLYNPFVYDFLQRLIPLNQFITISALTMGAAQIIFVYNFIHSLMKGEKASQNPWDVGTLEWTIPSPAPHYNFKEIPVVKCGPHEYGNPLLKDKDFQYQTEELVKA